MDGHAPDHIQFYCCKPEDLTEMEQAQETEVQFAELPSVPPALVYKDSILADIPAKMTATGLKKGYKAAETVEETKAERPAIELRRPDFEQRVHGLTPAERGTAHHLFMQFCDFDACANGKVEEEIERLRIHCILSEEQADAVEPARIHRFFTSHLYRKQMCKGEIRREFKFSVTVPVSNYYPEASSVGDEVLLQGVIDCLSETEEGFMIIDFKTDRVGRNYIQERAEQYRTQLDAYQVAVEKIFGKPVLSRALYFFTANSTIYL